MTKTGKSSSLVVVSQRPWLVDTPHAEAERLRSCLCDCSCTSRVDGGSLRRLSFARNIQGSSSIEGYEAALDVAAAVAVTFYDLKNRPGRWRAGSIYVPNDDAGDVVYEGPDVDVVPGLMAELVEELNGPRALRVTHMSSSGRVVAQTSRTPG